MDTTPTPARRIATVLLASRRWVLVAMLLALHAALVSDPGGNFQRIWMLVHFGLFLLWQPFFAAETELEVFSAVLLAAITAAVLWFLSGWMLLMWVSVLLGILGGKVFTVRGARRAHFTYLAAFGYLVAMQLVWGVPTLLLPEQVIPGPIGLFARWILPFVLVALVVTPAPPAEEPGQVFDFFYAVLVFQLVVVMVLGSVAVMRYTGDAYFPSVVVTMCGFGIALFILAVLWSPRGGFGGLRTLFSRYLLSVGMPFEMWMRKVAELAQTEGDPRRFLEEALSEIGKFPWMRGGTWKSSEGDGRFGELDGFPSSFTYRGLELTFHTGVRLSPALFLHMRLLAQVVGEFYEGKRRESALRKHAYFQAVHETGARLTHDIKNLLQSLYALTSVAPKEASDEYTGLLQRQLPQLTRRLHTTLEKLRAPEVAAADVPADAATWWADAEKRHAGTGIAFNARLALGTTVPAGLFDALLENFLDNARAKRAREPAIHVSVDFETTPGGATLAVCDTGTPVEEAVVECLFRDPIERSTGEGMGIGLYQAARLARAAGYAVDLSANESGNVCFRVAPAEKQVN